MKRVVLMVFAFLAMNANPTSAQTQDELVSVFSGAWRVYDFAYVDGGPCTIALTSNAVAEAFAADQAYCRGGLERVAGWGIDRGQLVLLDRQRAPVARLGGNEKRISGDMSDGRMVILERTRPGDPEPSPPDCLFVGYTQQCATGADRLPPKPGAAGAARAETLVNLVFREQPRPDSQTLTVVEQGTCIAFSECRVDSDGPWCRATIQGAEVWARQHAIRLGEFPVLTFRSGQGGGCSNTSKFIRSE